MTGERFGADSRCGSVSCTRSGEWTSRSSVSSANCSAAGPAAARAAKELARTPLTADETARRIAAHRTSDEGQEGLQAFLEKRAPAWR